jgi:flagellar biosynthesis protein FlhB
VEEEILFNFTMKLDNLLERRQKMNKKGQLITKTVMGIAFLILSVIITLVLVVTVKDAGLLTANTAEQNLVENMTTNFTAGINEVQYKFVTILTILAVVFLFGALVLLVGLARRMNTGGTADSI